MFKGVIIHIAALLLSITPFNADAFSEYEVDWPSSNNGVHTLRITIDKCTTYFHIKDKDFQKFTENNEAVSDALKKAIERSSSGCKN